MTPETHSLLIYKKGDETMTTIHCDFCNKKAAVLYFPESKVNEKYKPKLSGVTLCRMHDNLCLFILRGDKK